MGNIRFGNLMDWGQVLETLEDMTKKGRLSEHQGELIRLLRFNQNWRLREAAIEALEFVDHPSLDLAKEVFSIVKRKDLYYDVRILAVDGLSKLMERIVDRQDLNGEDANAFVDQTISGLAELLETPEPPKFHDALNTSLNLVRRVGKAA
ncbi:MAG: hypothetical protein GY737_10330 [Desulfobacteraceae bacterium]|nr:hypothetical protein [Desulfobacteraceae bacterium]